MALPPARPAARAVLTLLLAVAPAARAMAAQPLVGAPLDDTHAFAVAVCQGPGACTIDSPNCTGTLVAPNLVLTARHCVDFGLQLAEDFCGATFLGIVTTEETLVAIHPAPYAAGAAPDWIPASKVLLPADPRVCEADLALILLSRSVPTAAATPATVDVATNLALDPPAEVAVVGRGWLEAALPGPLPGASSPEVVDDGGLRRRVLEHVAVRCVSDLPGGCTTEDASDPTGVFTSTPGAMLVAGSTLPGDSGAGLLDQASFTAGAPALVAVATFGTWDLAGRPNGAGGVRVSRHRAFLVAGALEAAAAAGSPPPAWALEGSEAGAGCGCGPGGANQGSAGWLLLALFALAAKRRRGAAR